MQKYDFIIIGAGVLGLALTREIRKHHPKASILILEKEKQEAEHASGRNSGVLHAGFYYTSNSLKARLTAQGNTMLKAYCQDKGIPINACGKLVVAQNAHELEQLHELKKRGDQNGAQVQLISKEHAQEIEPNVATHKQALYSPTTASIDPKLVCHHLKEDLLAQGVEFSFDTLYMGRWQTVIETSRGNFQAKHLINCAGLYADKIAKDYGFGKEYTILPFKGLYLKYTKNKSDVKTNIYPVPNLNNPFLGVHFTKTASGDIKIGPTAIPAFWRENYAGLARFHALEVFNILGYEAKLFASNAFGFRNLAFEEMRKYRRSYFVSLAQKMIPSIDPEGFTEFTKPGIRAQLLHKKTSQLVQDFVIEGDKRSTHILNAVSPAFTCSLSFAQYAYTQMK